MTELMVSKRLEEIQQNAAQSDNEPRFVRNFPVGNYIRQGDVYLVRLPDLSGEVTSKDVEKVSTAFKDARLGEAAVAAMKSKRTPRQGRQVADGTSIGARHCVSNEAKCWDVDVRNELTGPIVSAPERFTLTHPEHAHVSLPRGDYGVIYQRDLQRESARVMD